MASAVPPAQTPAGPGVSRASSPATATSIRDGDGVPVVSAPVASGAAAAPSKGLTLREVNAARIAFVVSRIASFFKGGCRGDPSYLVQPCYTLARGIDFSVTAGEIYANAHDLPPLLKQVYKFRHEVSLQPAIMVLLISVKNACRKGWFQVAERNELLAMATEMSGNFCYGSDTPKESRALSVISMIMPRFYPRMKLGSLLVSFEAKPGYDVLVADFNVPRNIPPQEKIRLFVAQKDNMETSSCLISPPHVNFLINGRGVERRTSGYADVGPQFPTDITKMLKYGTNLIQAIGYFDGNFVIAIAFMSTTTSSSISVLQDYVQPAVATVAQDAELIEGPSKISLTCPISFRRIKTPVKGHNCKHHQCFDYENFMAMNARKPSWRCPHCNQPVSCIDIRIDQNMVKILTETGQDVAHVVISADGSWKVLEHHGNADKLQNEMLKDVKDDSIVCEPNRPPNSSDVVDLTAEDDTQANLEASPRQVESFNILPNQSGNSNICDIEERKPFQDALQDVFQGFSVSQMISAAHPIAFTSDAIQVTHGQVRDDLWPRTSLATSTSVATGFVSGPYTQIVGTGLHMQNPSLDPVITDAISPSLNREDSGNLLLPTSAIQSSTQARQFMDNLQSQQTRFGNSIVGEAERHQIPRHVNRTPIAIQALPAQSQMPSYHQRPRAAALSISSVPSISVQTSPSMLVNTAETNAANTGTGMQQFSRIPNLVLPSTQLHSVIQNQDVQSSQYMMPNPAPHQVVSLPAQCPANVRPLPNQQRLGSFSMQPQMGGQIPQQQHQNLRTLQTISQTMSTVSQPSRFSSIPVQPAAQGAVSTLASGLVNHNQVMTAQQSGQSARFQAALQAARSPLSFQASGDNLRVSGGEQVRNAGEGTPEALRSSGFGDGAAEQNWRPTGRMRGSLTGSAYATALSHYMLQPSQLASSRSASADQSGAVTSEHYSLLFPDGVNANGSLTEQPSLRNEDSGGQLRV